MVAAAPPPVLEAVRQTLLAPPPAVAIEFAFPEPAGLAGAIDKHEIAVAKAFQRSRLHLQHIRAGIDVLADRDEMTVAEIERLIVLAEAAVAKDASMVSEVRATRDRVLKLPITGSLRVRTKRLMNRLVDTSIEHHNGLVNLTLRLKAIAAALDPDSKIIVATSSTPDDVKAFFASLRAS